MVMMIMTAFDIEEDDDGCRVPNICLSVCIYIYNLRRQVVHYPQLFWFLFLCHTYIFTHKDLNRGFRLYIYIVYSHIPRIRFGNISRWVNLYIL